MFYFDTETGNQLISLGDSNLTKLKCGKIQFKNLSSCLLLYFCSKMIVEAWISNWFNFPYRRPVSIFAGVVFRNGGARLDCWLQLQNIKYKICAWPCNQCRQFLGIKASVYAMQKSFYYYYLINIFSIYSFIYGHVTRKRLFYCYKIFVGNRWGTILFALFFAFCTVM